MRFSQKTLYGIAGLAASAVLLGTIFLTLHAGGDASFASRNLTAQIQEAAVDLEKVELATSQFYVRLLLVGLAAAGVLFGVFAVILVATKRTFLLQSKDLQESLAKLQHEVGGRELQLRQLTEREVARSKEIARLKDEFIFIAAHELRAPVAAIEGNIFLFLSDAASKNLSQENLEILEDVRIAAGRLSQLVVDLLSVARIESGTIRIAFEKVSVAEPLLGAIRETAQMAEKAHVRIVFDVQEIHAAPMVMGDMQRLGEVFGNLISNAIKYNVSEGLVRISLASENGYVTITISDTGIGMNTEELQQVFSKFWRANPSVEGTGLGLWITKQIIEKMRGVVAVESTKGKGSTFKVSLKMLQ